jgi:peptide/nickel transport system ATP-binding protein
MRGRTEDMQAHADAAPLLDVIGLSVEYLTPRGPAKAVDGASFSIAPGEVLGLAGESGSGKSTAAHAILRLLKAPAVIRGGKVLYKGVDTLAMAEDELADFRWKEASIVFQGAMNVLNPVARVVDQLGDAMTCRGASKREARLRAEVLFDLVGIGRSRLSAYPHQLSGGMRQRTAIAMALALEPSLIIMDEPTTALDVVVQKDILGQISALRAKMGFSMLFITHDLSLLAEIADRIAVMYAGRIVELAPSAALFASPRHPYTRGLMGSFPSLSGERRTLFGIPGSPPDLVESLRGCPFQPRCPVAIPRCLAEAPELEGPAGEKDGRLAACHLAPGRTR